MKKYIGCDMHKKYSVFVAMDEKGRLEPAVTVANDTLELRSYLATVQGHEKPCRELMRTVIHVTVIPRWVEHLNGTGHEAWLGGDRNNRGAVSAWLDRSR